jgi:hypothetical protein
MLMIKVADPVVMFIKKKSGMIQIIFTCEARLLLLLASAPINSCYE